MDKIADEKKKEWWEKYLKHTIKFRGANLVDIRKELKVWYTKEHIDHRDPEEQLELALSFFAEEYAEDKLVGVLFLQEYVYNKFSWDILVPKFETLFENGYIYDWNVCDWFCVRILCPLIKENGLPCAEAIAKWNASDNVWQARASLVSFVNLTKEEEFRQIILDSCHVLIRRNERFAKTAVGWALRELSKLDEKLVVDFIKKNKDYFSKESLENAIKYFTLEEKAKLKNLIPRKKT
ncbi:DNA alkylation repair protein [Methanococcoides methylutens]|uniref:DNA alkylation repair protein n=1 Tax=Methanococcoides methylutens TaxID=2226 RepID=UPI00404458D3